jgi:hypothetical protein
MVTCVRYFRLLKKAWKTKLWQTAIIRDSKKNLFAMLLEEMPEDGLLDCLSCVSGTQEDMELKRRSKKIDRWDRGRNL